MPANGTHGAHGTYGTTSTTCTHGTYDFVPVWGIYSADSIPPF